MDIVIKKLDKSEIIEFSDMIKEVYDEFVSCDYSDIGNRTFYDFIDKNRMLDRFNNGNLMICAVCDGKIIGACEVRNKNHIALFFVRKQYQNMKIGKKIFDYSLKTINEEATEVKKISVNSSPYALSIYQKLGFIETSGLQEKDGIKYIPMEYKF